MLISVSVLCKLTTVPLNSIKTLEANISPTLFTGQFIRRGEQTQVVPIKGSAESERLREDAALPKRIIIRRFEAPSRVESTGFWEKCNCPAD